MEKQTKIGTVPLGWKEKKLKDVFYINELSLPSNTPADYQFRYITIEQVSTNHIDYENCEAFRFSDASGRARRIVRDNDILISGVRPNLKSFAIFENPDAGNWICSTGFYVLTAKNEDDNLISYYELLSEIGERQFYSYVAGSNYPAIGDSDIRNIRLVLPSSAKEQTAIANILSKVDEAIASVQGSIASAERLKKSLMQNLLTGRMKTDGTLRKEDEFYMDEKFGKVPMGWEVKAVGDKSVCHINPNYKYKKKELYDFVPMEAVRENFGGLAFVEKQVIDNGSYTRFKAGDILFAKITPCSENGKVAYIEHIDSEVGFASTEFIVFQPMDNVNGRFVYLLLASENVHRLAISLMEGTTGRQRIPWKIFRNRIFVPMPEKDEQTEIVNRLVSFDKLITDKKLKIATLERLKKSLMQNLLTGRVRVKVN